VLEPEALVGVRVVVDALGDVRVDLVGRLVLVGVGLRLLLGDDVDVGVEVDPVEVDVVVFLEVDEVVGIVLAEVVVGGVGIVAVVGDDLLFLATGGGTSPSRCASASSAVSVPDSASTWCGLRTVPSARRGSSSLRTRSRPSSSE
jgi:hypothetical protein